jgi:hypothetical protein
MFDIVERKVMFIITQSKLDLQWWCKAHSLFLFESHKSHSTSPTLIYSLLGV